ncbi:hypothetical protein [Spirosoma sp. KNUC1025]|uniref:hypothetical protein n=1 Tax=Spirosoma sp. KNUC1025 TaxID=2894082 RepID=UPI00386AB23B|nr:hypothetical protein LN737_00515 [Spirosoma sp. KNUC1025]
MTTGVNAGVALGFKNNNNIYTPYYKLGKDNNNRITRLLINHKLTTIGFTPAIFAGLTTIGLSEKNTSPTIGQERTVLGINYGVLFAVNINKFSLGGAIGFDTGFGKDSKSWVYQNKPWLGLVVGFDFL